MKIVIIEDETAATVNLRSVISEVKPQARVVACIESVADAVEWFGKNPDPDVVFMDIHLADADAFRIFGQVTVNAPVIFTTAYDQYAIEAFKVNGIDYILKPIKKDDVRKAFDKLERLTGTSETRSRMIAELGTTVRRTAAILINHGDKIVPVKVTDIVFCYMSGENVRIDCAGGYSYRYERSLDSLMDILPDDSFFRANRQFIVNRDFIEDVSVWFGNRLAVNLKSEVPERIIISKARVPVFKNWLMGL